MNISYNWLQRHIKEKLPIPESLKEKIIFHAFEVEDMKNLGEDTIFDIKVLPDRAHDCLGHAGMAREIAGLLGLTFISSPLPELPASPLSLKVEMQSDLCRRYIAVEMKDIQVGPSPAWLKDAIEGVGIRSINNVVDATNLILLDDGQPVHAYDADKVDGGIVVRLAHENEQIITLSAEEKKLLPTDIVIADYLGPLAIAGVKGGKSAEISEGTKRIIIEVATFDPIAIRKTSRRLSLITDASKRFENGISADRAYGAAQHAVAILQKVAGGEVVGMIDEYKTPEKPRLLSFKHVDITRVLGATVADSDIDLWLSRYNIIHEKEGDTYSITIPKDRFDITGTHDLAEEIGRLIGYDRIPALPLPFTPVVTRDSEYHQIASVKYWLAQNGFREIMNYTFVKKGDVAISYGPKDRSALRSNLSDTLKESYEKNRINAALLGLDTIRIFEIGTVFIGQEEKVHVATCDKGTSEELPLSDFTEKYKIDRNALGSTGEVVGVFKMWSPYPFVTRDIAVWIGSPDDQPLLEEVVTTFATQYCVRQPVLFDHFEKDGRTSVAYRFVFQSYEKTLTEDEVEKWFGELTQKIQAISGCEIR